MNPAGGTSQTNENRALLREARTMNARPLNLTVHDIEDPDKVKNVFQTFSVLQATILRNHA